MEEVDLTKCEKVGSEPDGCAVGKHVFDRSKVSLRVTDITKSRISMKCLLCGANVDIDVDWSDEKDPNNTGINDLAQKYQEDIDVQKKQIKQEQSVDIQPQEGVLDDAFWNKLMGKR